MYCSNFKETFRNATTEWSTNYKSKVAMVEKGVPRDNYTT